MALVIILKCVLIMLLINKTIEQHNPCPDIFEYVYNNHGSSQYTENNFYGIVTIPILPEYNNFINLSVSVEVLNAVKESEKGYLTLMGTADDGINNLPLRYKMNFPPWVYPFMPQLLSITVNDHEICFGPSILEKEHYTLLNRFTVTIVTLTYYIEITNEQNKLSTTITSRIGKNDNKYEFNPQNPLGAEIYSHFPQFASSSNNSVQNNIFAPRHESTLNLNKCGITYSRSEDAPWMVALFQQTTREIKFLCGANVISKIHVLTAAQCVTQHEISELTVFFGRSMLHDDNQQKYVSKIEVSSDADLALIVLTDPAVFSSKVQPVCLWNGQTNFMPIIGREGIIVGWDSKEDSGTLNGLHQARMHVVSSEKCWSRVAPNKMFCTGYSDGSSSSQCKSDVGSGFYFKINGRWTIRGIALNSSPIKDLCVFLDVAKHLNWLLSHLT